MLSFLIKALISGLIVALVALVARKSPGLGGLIAALPLTSVLAMIWLWRDTNDAMLVAALANGAFWFVLPSLPMFLAIPAMLRSGVNFWVALAIGCVMTMALMALVAWLGPRLGIRL